MSKFKIGITHGDPNGIGYEVILKALEDARMLELFTPVIYGSAKMASWYRKTCNMEPVQLQQIASASDAKPDQINIINVVDQQLTPEPGKCTQQAGAAALAALEQASADLKDGFIDALVTAPISKEAIQSPEFQFAGHTEYLESKAAVQGSTTESPRALMILCNESMRVALVTIHTPISQVPQGVTRQTVLQKISDFATALEKDFGLPNPRIAVLALNPHAGENTLLGSEEAQEITPAIEDARAQRINAFGPYSADGFFGAGHFDKFDGILAMYHDQGLAPFKAMAMDSGVNITAGLPWVRTSPDHGTGFDIAGQGIASAQSLRQAIYAAIDALRNRINHATAHANPLQHQNADRHKRKSEPQ